MEMHLKKFAGCGELSVKVSEFQMTAIGTIITPFNTLSKGIPIQGRLHPDAVGTVEIKPEYSEGLNDLEGFSHIILLYYFHHSKVTMLKAKPYMDDTERGIFSIRSPHRPNPIGMTLVELLGIDGNILQVKGVDMISGTPLLDIKPFSPSFDTVKVTRMGWMEQFLNGKKEKKHTFVNDEDEWMHND